MTDRYQHPLALTEADSECLLDYASRTARNAYEYGIPDSMVVLKRYCPMAHTSLTLEEINERISLAKTNDGALKEVIELLAQGRKAYEATQSDE